uniref:Uncharacterized protein n=1 Tax=Ditylenchus dipsaci TaxID=166011 RepID=A0A915DPA3_9BILA
MSGNGEFIDGKFIDGKFINGAQIYLWFSASIVWAIYFVVNVIPVLFSGIYFSWFMNPYIGYREDPQNIVSFSS